MSCAPNFHHLPLHNLVVGQKHVLHWLEASDVWAAVAKQHGWYTVVHSAGHLTGWKSSRTGLVGWVACAHSICQVYSRH